MPLEGGFGRLLPVCCGGLKMNSLEDWLTRTRGEESDTGFGLCWGGLDADLWLQNQMVELED